MALATLIPLTLIFCLIRLNGAKSFQQKGDGPRAAAACVRDFFSLSPCNFRSTDEREVSDCDSQFTVGLDASAFLQGCVMCASGRIRCTVLFGSGESKEL